MLTFESIRDIESAERESKKLQKLPEGFFDQLSEYIQKKNDNDAKTDVIMNVIKRLFEMREKKIVDSALIAARTGLPAENLSEHEKPIFDALVEILKKFRSEILNAKKQETFIVKQSLPEFIGPDMKIYKLRENEIVKLPKPLSDLLLKEGVVQLNM